MERPSKRRKTLDNSIPDAQFFGTPTDMISAPISRMYQSPTHPARRTQDRRMALSSIINHAVANAGASSRQPVNVNANAVSRIGDAFSGIGDDFSARNDSLAGWIFSCSECKKGFQAFEDFYKHMEEKGHHQPTSNQHSRAASTEGDTETTTASPPTFTCALCKESHPDYPQLKHHIEQTLHCFPPDEKTTTARKDLSICITCQRSFIDEVDFGMHLNDRGHHPPPDNSFPGTFECPVCGEVFPGMLEQGLHIESMGHFKVEPSQEQGDEVVPANDDNVLSCVYCHEIFFTGPDFLEHMRDTGHDPAKEERELEQATALPSIEGFDDATTPGSGGDMNADQ
ncbi:hypothetical protein PRZ48_009818 [Zasmidium cellare]|uniref:C2H2-type domain-containing protein n=1 Tax=Zasmidium cellare TaxID=395010 RepID=A0ABR0EDU0_ZASCE|nr:hypothetical protein PRZ48_009818 [Zasmidium cellare]